MVNLCSCASCCRSGLNSARKLKQNIEEERLAVSSLVAKIFGIIMVVLYVALGTTIIIKSRQQTVVEPKYAVVFGSVLILYGFFRAFKVYRTHYSERTE
jgi:hypothetical protein